MPRRLLIAYFAATALFALADFGFGLNVRTAFLDGEPGWRGVYYGICLVCLAAMLWRPGWAETIAAVESVFVLAALIINMGSRVMLVTDAMLETGSGPVTMPEIANFAIAGGAAYLSFVRGEKALAARPGRP